MTNKQLKDLFRWIRDCEFTIDADGCAVLTRAATLKLYDYKQEVGNFLACEVMDRPLKLTVEE